MKDLFQRNIQFWGEENQKIISNASILIAGVGGLGCVLAETLTRAGIGRLILIDSDIVELTNLNRQILFDQNDIGKPKVEIAQQKLKMINPELEVDVFFNDIADLREKRLPYFEGIADCLDNFASRFELEKFLSYSHFLVHGGVQNDFGQITTIKPELTQSLKDIYPQIHIPVSNPVIPQVVFAIGSLMAQEVLNNLFNKPELLNSMLVLELDDFSMFKIDLKDK